MAERRVSLLDCAIAASLGVVPVLAGVIALVAIVRPADPESVDAQGRSDRYVSVRRVAALKTFEHAVVRRGSEARAGIDADAVLAGVPACRNEWGGGSPLARRWRELSGTAEATPAERVALHVAELDAALLAFSGRANSRVEHRVGFDPARWFAAAATALATPVDAEDAPGRQFQVRCADLVAALASLRRADAAMLEALVWRGSVGSATLAGWRADQHVQITAREVTRRNPWGGVPGCIYLGALAVPRGDEGGGEGRAGSDGIAPAFVASPRSAQQRVCGMAEARGVVAAASGAPPAASGVGSRPPPVAIAGEPGAADAADDPRWQVPPSLFALLQPLETLRQPTGALYRAYAGDADAPPRPHAGRVASRNHVVLDGAPVDVGYAIDLTIDPALQALAQKTAACYTGRHDVCRALGIRRAEDGDRPLGNALLEGAMLRMAAVAVIDVASGRIEALAGALSPCARQDVDGPGRDEGCDARLPGHAGHRDDALLNPAVYHAAMPASTVKPILASAFLADGERGARLLAAERAAMQRGGVPASGSLRGQLMRSDSARFLDRMFCAEQGFAGCRLPWDVQAATLGFGWNSGCDDGSRAPCGSAELLFGRSLARDDDAGPLAPAPAVVAYGRLLSEPDGKALGAAMRPMPAAPLAPAVVRRCALGADGRRGSDDDWEKCKGGAVVDVVAEGWGQGHARASALGVAGMMAALAAAANGQTQVPRPHLVGAVRGVAGPAGDAFAATAARWTAPGTLAPKPPRDAAEVILSGLTFSHRAGTARTACEQVLDARRCRDIDWLAGKTGTPSFPGDELSLDAIGRLCRPGAAPSPEARRACGSLRPYKWYVAAFRADRARDGPWTKAIAVLAERNWLRASGRIHGAGDHGPNPAAEIALQIVGRTTGAIEGPTP